MSLSLVTAKGRERECNTYLANVRIPSFTVFLLALQWLCYTYTFSVTTQEQISNSSYPNYLSCPNEWMRNVAWSKCCSSPSTIVSHHLFHINFHHIIGNQALLIVVGSISEQYNGRLFTCILYFVGIVAGAALHSTAWPSTSLVGCSHGI